MSTTHQKPGHLIVERINKTRRQVRTVELVTTLVTLVACLLIFLLVSVLVDHWVFKNGTPRELRWFALFGVVAAGIVWFVVRLIPLIRFSINPAYAAEVLEKWHPDMKNRLVNWVFLRREKRDKTQVTQVERLVLESVGRETAANLKAIPDQFVVDCSAMIRWGIVLACVLAMFCVYIMLSPKNTLQSITRAATPYVNIDAPQSIVIKEVEPGDADVYQGETLQIKARLDRPTRKPVHVVFSTNDGRLIDQRVPMKASDDGMRFECLFPPGKRGFEESLTYRIEVGDGRSKTFAITVNPSIAIDVKSVEYHYPAYTKLPVRKVENSGDLRAVEGTQVIITARSNIAMSNAMLLPDDDVSRADKLQIAPSKTEAQGRLTLGFEPNQPTKPVCTTYTLRCWDDNQRTNPLPNVYRVEVVRDEPPTVKWVDNIDEREALQVSLNEPLTVAVEARDPDFGLQYVRLRGTVTRVVAGGGMRPGSTLPETTDLPLDTMELLRNPPRTGTTTIKQTLVPSKLGLQVGDRVTYFAEAVDTKEPNPNTAATSPRVFVVTDIDPDKPLDPPVNDEPQEQNDQNQNQPGQADNQNGDNQDGTDQSDNQDTNDGNGGQQQPPDCGGAEQDSQQPGDEKQDDQSDNQQGDQQNRQQQRQSQNSQQQDQEKDQQRNQNSEQVPDTSNTGDTEGATGGEDQQNQGGGQESDGVNDNTKDGANAQGAGGGDEQRPDNGPQQKSGGQEGKNANQKQNDQTGNQTNGQQNANTGEGQQQNQPGQKQNQQPGGSQNNGRNPAAKRDKIDGESNPADVFQETLDHIRETGEQAGEQDDSANRDTNNQKQDGERVEGGPPPKTTPQHDNTQTTDRTDALKTQSGYDPNADQLDPNSDMPIFGNSDDDRANATEAAGTGRSMTDDQSKGDSPQRGNAQVDNTSNDSPNARTQSGNSDQNGQQDNQSPSHLPQTPKENGQSNAPSDAGTSSQQPLHPGNENATSEGHGNMSGNGGGGQPQNMGQGTTDNTPESQPEAANLEYTRQATDLAIRYLEDELGKERPDPRLLERLGGWNEHDLRRFVERWKEMQQQANQSPGTREGERFEETLRNLGSLAPKATVNINRNNTTQQRTTTTESQRYAAPAKYTERANAYTEGINK